MYDNVRANISANISKSENAPNVVEKFYTIKFQTVTFVQKFFFKNFNRCAAVLHNNKLSSSERLIMLKYFRSKYKFLSYLTLSTLRPCPLQN